MKEIKVTKKELWEARFFDNGIHSVFVGYCRLHGCCDCCNRSVRMLCKIKDRIAKMQESIILNNCIKPSGGENSEHKTGR